MKKRLLDCKMRKKDENIILKKKLKQVSSRRLKKERKNVFKIQRN